MSFLKTIKNCYYISLKVKSRLLFGRPVLVMMYHRINNSVGEKLTGLSVDISNFEKHLLFYKNNFQILRLEEEWTSLKKTGLVITFDDGYADNIINALPLLEKYQLPATIFVTTLNIDSKDEFWWDRLVFDYSNCKESFFVPNQNNAISKSNRSYKILTDFVHALRNEDKEEWFLAFEKINNISFSHREEFRSLTNSELKFLSEHPLISIGIHTHNHYSLGTLSYEEQKKELQLSIQNLNELTTQNIKYLALPHGSYNQDTIEVMNDLNLSAVLLANNYYSSSENKASRKIYRILMPNIKDKELRNYIKKYDFKIW